MHVIRNNASRVIHFEGKTGASLLDGDQWGGLFRSACLEDRSRKKRQAQGEHQESLQTRSNRVLTRSRGCLSAIEGVAGRKKQHKKGCCNRRDLFSYKLDIFWPHSATVSEHVKMPINGQQFPPSFGAIA
jgi:hypothetical protein